MVDAKGSPLSMFGVDGEFRERMKRLRLRQRWDQAQLGRASGLSATTISQIETGKTLPTRQQLDSIATGLGYTIEFLAAELKMVQTTRPWLRAYADAGRREADARTADAAIAAEYVRRLKLRPLPDLLPSFSGDIDDDDSIEDAGLELRTLADIEPDAVVINAIRAAERLGCIVLPLQSEVGRHLGMSVRSDQLPMVCIAKNVPGDRQRLTVAHELGHLVLHGEMPPPRSADESARMERQAYRFASAFLVPRDALKDTLDGFGGKVTLNVLAQVKSIWGVSIKSLVGRFQAMGVIDADHARSLYKQISARKWSSSEPVNVPTETAQWFHRTLVNKAGIDDVATAARVLAAKVGGKASDLIAWTNWEPPVEAKVLRFEARDRNPSVGS